MRPLLSESHHSITDLMAACLPEILNVECGKFGPKFILCDRAMDNRCIRASSCRKGTLFFPEHYDSIGRKQNSVEAVPPIRSRLCPFTIVFVQKQRSRRVEILQIQSDQIVLEFPVGDIPCFLEPGYAFW